MDSSFLLYEREKEIENIYLYIIKPLTEKAGVEVASSTIVQPSSTMILPVCASYLGEGLSRNSRGF